MTYQMIMVMETHSDGLRSEAIGWDAEDGRNARDATGRPVGLIRGWVAGCPETPLHAMGRGWRLMAPPVVRKGKGEDGVKYKLWDWWFEKLVETP